LAVCQDKLCASATNINNETTLALKVSHFGDRQSNKPGFFNAGENLNLDSGFLLNALKKNLPVPSFSDSACCNR
jgi:hypothetical protein